MKIIKALGLSVLLAALTPAYAASKSAPPADAEPGGCAGCWRKFTSCVKTDAGVAVKDINSAIATLEKAAQQFQKNAPQYEAQIQRIAVLAQQTGAAAKVAVDASGKIAQDMGIPASKVAAVVSGADKALDAASKGSAAAAATGTVVIQDASAHVAAVSKDVAAAQQAATAAAAIVAPTLQVVKAEVAVAATTAAAVKS